MAKIEMKIFGNKSNPENNSKNQKIIMIVLLRRKKNNCNVTRYILFQ